MHYKKDKSKEKANVDILDSALSATKDCDVMIVIGNRPRDDRHCLAYFNNYDNYHLQVKKNNIFCALLTHVYCFIIMCMIYTAFHEGRR